MGETDADLIERVEAGDRLAFEAVVRRYQKLVFSIAYHYLGNTDLAEDVSQDVFLRLFQSLSRYDKGRPLKNWVGRIAANRCIDELRKRKKEIVSSLSDFTAADQEDLQRFYDYYQGGRGLTEEEADRCTRLLHRAMQELGANEKAAFILREMKDLEYDEVAEMLGITPVAARIRVSRARKKIQERLEELTDERF